MLKPRTGIALLVASLAFASQVLSQAFPSKPIRFIVGFPPGGATDAVTRAIAPKWASHWASRCWLKITVALRG